VQCLAHAERLRAALIAFDWTKLEFSRQPREPDDDDNWDWFDRFADRAVANDRWGSTRLVDFVRDYPEAVADFLDQMGVTIEDIEANIS
jgi:hypothetical protein